ncbi:MAG: MFS transporter [Faecousia sp.]
MKKTKDPNRLRFKDYFGTSAMSVSQAVGNVVMTNLFMLYLTDYAGIGKWGAVLGSALLMIARIFDAVNDPLEGWIIDRAKVGKYGKYRPFVFLSVILISAGLIGLFSLPGAFSNNPVMICVWVIFFYLLYDVGFSFYQPHLVYRTMTLDQNERGKLFIGPRMINMLVGMVGAALITIITGVNASFNNMHTSFSVTISTLVLICAVVTLIGVAMVKERHHAKTEEGDSVKLTDIFGVLKENGALRIRVLDMLFSGFIWTFLFATTTYYIKWGYCTDLNTGVVDQGTMGTLMLFASMMMFLPLIIGTFIASPLMKLFGSAYKFHRFLILCQCIPCALLFVLQITGLLLKSPVVFLACLAISATAIGCDYIPGETLSMECMDYQIYKCGKDRTALCGACYNFLGKAQAAVSSGLIGVILVAVGYEVDSATDTFLGELSAIPQMLTWFIVIMGLIPAILGIVSWLILGKYPITDEIRKDMNEKLSR